MVRNQEPNASKRSQPPFDTASFSTVAVYRLQHRVGLRTPSVSVSVSMHYLHPFDVV